MKLELDGTLAERIKAHVVAAGYSSAEEFVQHAIEQELVKSEAEGEDSAKRLRGIGYIDAGLDI
jgi:hypothetical protein